MHSRSSRSAMTGRSWRSLIGTSPKGDPCCSAVGVARSAAGGRFGAPRQHRHRTRRRRGRTAADADRRAARRGRDRARCLGRSVVRKAGLRRDPSTQRIALAAGVARCCEPAPRAEHRRVDGADRRLGAARRGRSTSRPAPPREPRGRARATITVPAGHRIDELAARRGAVNADRRLGRELVRRRRDLPLASAGRRSGPWRARQGAVAGHRTRLRTVDRRRHAWAIRRSAGRAARRPAPARCARRSGRREGDSRRRVRCRPSILRRRPRSTISARGRTLRRMGSGRPRARRAGAPAVQRDSVARAWSRARTSPPI